MTIPKEFRDQILLHFYRLDHKDSLYKSLLAPRILCIEGAPGIGKSSQLRQVLREMGSAFQVADASSFGGRYENDPVRQMSELLRSLEDCHVQGESRPTLVIDDADLSLGRNEATQYTVNTQLTTGWLMSLADEVYAPAFTENAPAIIITGNNLASVYSPLLRQGRAKHYLYQPSKQDIKEILVPIVSELLGYCVALTDLPDDLSIADILNQVTELIDAKALSRIHDPGLISETHRLTEKELKSIGLKVKRLPKGSSRSNG
jgi:SpoVK/Ycf46/Vps4 family AAA+-type ATPase